MFRRTVQEISILDSRRRSIETQKTTEDPLVNPKTIKKNIYTIFPTLYLRTLNAFRCRVTLKSLPPDILSAEFRLLPSRGPRPGKGHVFYT